MTATDVRDRLDDRFHLLVGSRRGLERHQTLRHAVQWSHDLLNEAEKHLLTRCSVFAGRFDLPAVCAVTGMDDEFATLELLDALVRKSLLVAHRTSQRARYSMLETIRQFAEEQLVALGQAEDARAAHATYYASQETDILALWDSPRQREAYDWFTVELANLRAAFRWAADHDKLDDAIGIAIYATFIGYWVEQYEPGPWAEEIIEPARAVEHSRLPQLYLTAAHCYIAGRIDDFLLYIEAGQSAIESGRFDEVPIVLHTTLGGGYLNTLSPERCVEWCRNVIAQSAKGYLYGGLGSVLVFALTFAGAHAEAMAVSKDLFDAADTVANPAMACGALLAYGQTNGKVDPAAAYDALRRGLTIAQVSGNRQMESIFSVYLSSVAATYADPADAFEFLALAIRTYYDSGSLTYVVGALGLLAAFLDRLGRYEPAVTISGFGDVPVAHRTFPEIPTAVTHLREVLGAEAYEAIARSGANMTNAARATYALDQIDMARASLLGDASQ